MSYNKMIPNNVSQDSKCQQKLLFTERNKFFFENFIILFCKFKKTVYLCALKQIHELWNVKLFIASCEARRMTLSA